MPGCSGATIRVTVSPSYLSFQFSHVLMHRVAKMREIVTASSAAGVAVAFGSPIGGVLFAIEVSSTPLRADWKLNGVGNESDVFGSNHVA